MENVMTTIAAVNSAALLILQQANTADKVEDKTSTSVDLTAVANGVAGKIGVSAQPGRSEAKISEALFSTNQVNINRLKIDLIERAAKELGFDKNDYDSDVQFASAMRTEVIVLAAREGGKEIIAKIEKEIGLDKLGVTLLDVVSSASNPQLDDKVTAALEKSEGVDKKDDEKSEDDKPLSIQPDENGVYDVLPG